MHQRGARTVARTRSKEMLIPAAGAPTMKREAEKGAEKKEPDLAQILREMEDELARDVSKVTAERSTFEEAEKQREEAQRAAKLSADTAAKIGAAASKCKKEQQSMQEDDRLNKIRARRRTRDLEQEAMDLLNGTLESVFKAADSNGDGSLGRDEAVSYTHLTLPTKA